VYINCLDCCFSLVLGLLLVHFWWVHESNSWITLPPHLSKLQAIREESQMLINRSTNVINLLKNIWKYVTYRHQDIIRWVFSPDGKYHRYQWIGARLPSRFVGQIPNISRPWADFFKYRSWNLRILFGSLLTNFGFTRGCCDNPIRDNSLHLVIKRQ
jgi:hypothetical protein